MQFKFTAPVEFFQSDHLPRQCVLTGRTDDVFYYHLDLPCEANGFRQNSSQIAFPARGRHAACLAAGEPAPLFEAPRGRRRMVGWIKAALLMSLGVWLFVQFIPDRWILVLLGGILGLLIIGLAVWSRVRGPALRMQLANRADRLRIPLGPPDAFWRWRRVREYIALALLLSPSIQYVAAPASPPGTIGMLLMVLMYLGMYSMSQFSTRITHTAHNRRVELRLPGDARECYQNLCIAFTRWKAATQFPTQIAYEIDDWANELNNNWDATTTPPRP